MWSRAVDLLLGAAARAARIVADEEAMLVLTPRFGGPSSIAGRPVPPAPAHPLPRPILNRIVR